MTRDEARQEARRRWPEIGAVHLRRGRFRVGIIEAGPIPMFRCLGLGDSWESAFADADAADAREGKACGG